MLFHCVLEHFTLSTMPTILLSSFIVVTFNVLDPPVWPFQLHLITLGNEVQKVHWFCSLFSGCMTMLRPMHSWPRPSSLCPCSTRPVPAAGTVFTAIFMSTAAHRQACLMMMRKMQQKKWHSCKRLPTKHTLVQSWDSQLSIREFHFSFHYLYYHGNWCGVESLSTITFDAVIITVSILSSW